MLFYKLTDNLNIPIERILTTIENVTDTATGPIVEGRPMPLGNTTEQVWQYYPYTKNILFLRNWKDLHSQLLVIVELKKLQNTIKESSTRNTLIDAFLKINFLPSAVGPIKVIGEVDSHTDITRKYAITIGLKNSNAYRTYASNEPTNATFTPNEELSYIVGDREVYITKVDGAHCVVPIGRPVERFTLSYSAV
jgi:hypothetical protein